MVNAHVDFLSTLMSRKVMHFSSEHEIFPSNNRNLGKENILPVAWRSTDTHLKIYFQKVPAADEAKLDEKKMSLGVTMKFKQQKGQILCIPWEKCAVHDSDTSDTLDDKKPLSMTLSYDNHVDALSIVFFEIDSDPSLRSHTNENIFIFDVDAKERIVAIEILGARRHLDLLF